MKLVSWLLLLAILSGCGLTRPPINGMVQGVEPAQQATTVATIDPGATAPKAKLLKGEWLNLPKREAPNLEGKVSVVTFFTFDCINCKHNLPYIAKLKQAASDNFQVLAVHTPELDYEHNKDNIKAALKSEGIDYPVLLDTDHSNWNTWEQKYWPTVYVLDKKGRIRFTWEGELNGGGNNGYEQVLDLVNKLEKE